MLKGTGRAVSPSISQPVPGDAGEVPAMDRSQESQTHMVSWFQSWRQHQAGWTPGLALESSSYACQTLHKHVPSVACSISVQTAHAEGFTSSDLPTWTFYWVHSAHGLAAEDPVPVSQGLYQTVSSTPVQKPGKFNYIHAKQIAKIGLNRSGLIVGREKRNSTMYARNHK